MITVLIIWAWVVFVFLTLLVNWMGDVIDDIYMGLTHRTTFTESVRSVKPIHWLFVLLLPPVTFFVVSTLLVLFITVILNDEKTRM